MGQKAKAWMVNNFEVHRVSAHGQSTTWTFDPKGSRNKGRRMLDPTLAAQGDGLILGKEIPLEEGYVRFGNKPIESFPIPAPAAA